MKKITLIAVALGVMAFAFLGDPAPPQGISVKRRVVELGGLPGFNDAIARGDTEGAVRILTGASFSEKEARLAVDAILDKRAT